MDGNQQIERGEFMHYFMAVASQLTLIEKYKFCVLSVPGF